MIRTKIVLGGDANSEIKVGCAGEENSQIAYRNIKSFVVFYIVI